MDGTVDKIRNLLGSEIKKHKSLAGVDNDE